jgi:predicted enzyme related to lactoylglutathione lyase
VSHIGLAIRHVFGDFQEEETMNPQVVTSLGVSDIDRAKRFFGEALGCSIGQDHGVFIAFKAGADGDGAPSLALYTGHALDFDAKIAGGDYRGVTLSFIVDSDQRVDEVMANVESGGGKVLQPAAKAEWGGYVGYFADPDGNLWKVVKGQGE